jgi:hypothetical protein
VICLSETWLNSSNTDFAVIENYAPSHKTRSKKMGGGVSVFVRYDLPFIARDDLSALNGVMESVFIEIDRSALCAERNVIIGCIYRPPDASIPEFNAAMKQILVKIVNERKHIYICGDFNIDLLNTDRHLPAAEFLETMFSSSLFPAISRPTRVSKTSATLIIDNIFVSPIFASDFVSGALISSISDHLPVFCCTPLLTPILASTPSLQKRNFCTANKERFLQSLQNVDWSQCLSLDACQSAFSEFYQKFSATFNECFPMIEAKSRYKSRKPWLTDGLKKAIKTKNKLYAKFVKSKSNTDLVAYNDYKKALRSILRRAERQHYDDLFLRLRNNMRKSWDVIKEVMHIQRTSNPKIALMIDNKETSDPLEVANAFNSFFSKVGPNLASKIPRCDRDPLSYIPYRRMTSMFTTPTDSTEISDIIKSLNDSAAGPDGISSEIIKRSLQFTVPPLTHIVNLSLQQGVFPDEMKVAKVIPLFKSGDKTSVNNYRPISLLPVFSKILEKSMANRLSQYLSENYILHPQQFGFRPKHTTSMAINILVDRISLALDSNKAFAGVALDFRKAFDTVDHSILLRKLGHYGIRGAPLKWFESYLSNRHQFVQLLNSKSTLQSIECGVPQGSIIGPILFLLYINDLPQATSLFSIMFADDSNVFTEGTSTAECLETLNKELVLLTSWIHSNKLSLNVEKSHLIVFSKARNPPNDAMVFLDGKQLTQVHSIKFLGVFIDDKLSWQQHINYIRGKLSRTIGILSRAKILLNQSTLRNIYFAFTHPYLTYCIDAWGQCSVQLFQSVFRLQKRAIRILTTSTRNAPTANLFSSLNILPLKDLYVQSIAIFMFKFHHHLLPPIFDNLFALNSQVHSINTRQSRLLHPPRTNTRFGQKSIRSRGCFIWNQLHHSLSTDSSLFSFKKHLVNSLRSGLEIRLTPIQ